MWPDWAKFNYFDKSLQVLANFLMVYFIFGKFQIFQFSDIIVLIFIVANGQISTNNPTIWSHWSEATRTDLFYNIPLSLGKNSRMWELQSVVDSYLDSFFLKYFWKKWHPLHPRQLLRRFRSEMRRRRRLYKQCDQIGWFIGLWVSF